MCILFMYPDFIISELENDWKEMGDSNVFGRIYYTNGKIKQDIFPSFSQLKYSNKQIIQSIKDVNRLNEFNNYKNCLKVTNKGLMAQILKKFIFNELNMDTINKVTKLNKKKKIKERITLITLKNNILDNKIVSESVYYNKLFINLWICEYIDKKNPSIESLINLKIINIININEELISKYEQIIQDDWNLIFVYLNNRNLNETKPKTTILELCKHGSKKSEQRAIAYRPIFISKLINLI